jgi:predicted enzyme related to lactoylglutathione lyase
MSLSIFTVVVDCSDPHRVAAFWSEALGWTVHERNPDELQLANPDESGISLYFMKVPEPKVGKNRLHLDLLAPGPMGSEVQRLLWAGAQLVEVRQDPPSLENPDTWTVMRDPEGNEFCVTSRETLTGWRDGVRVTGATTGR